MYGTIIYIALGLVTSAKVFEALVRYDKKTFYYTKMDAADVVIMSLISVICGAVFPLIVVCLLVYNFILQPIVTRINAEEEKDVRSMR